MRHKTAMRANPKTILFSAGIALALVLIVAALVSGTNRKAVRPQSASASLPSGPQLEQQQAQEPLHQARQPLDQSSGAVSNLGSTGSIEALQSALSEHDLTRRLELLRQWALTVPLGSMAGMLESGMMIQDPEVRSEVTRTLESRWAAKQPAAAAAMLAIHSAATPDNSNGAPEWIELLGRLITQWTDADPNQAAAWAQSQPPGPARSEAVVEITNQLVKEAAERADSNPEAAAAWASGLPDGEWRDRAIAGLATIWSRVDPGAAAAYTANLPQGSTQNQAIAAVALTWASKDPVRAAQWVAQFPECAVRNQALQGLIVTWAAKDPEEAAQWLKGLPLTPSRDLAVSAFSATIAASSPSTAFQWAETISDQTLRDQQLQTLAGVWLQMEPVAAREGISQSNLPPVIKSHFLAASTPPSD